MLVSQAELQQHVVRETDADGTLTHAGFWWRQPRPIARLLVDGANGLVLLLGIAAAIGGLTLLSRASDVGLVLLAIGAAAIWGAFRVHRVASHCGFWRKTVIFRIDGKVLYDRYPSFTLRLYDTRNTPPLEIGSYALSEISSIEMHADIPRPGPQPVIGTFAVSLFFTDGQQLMVAIGLLEPVARIIVVQLSQALKEIRESMANEPAEDTQ